MSAHTIHAAVELGHSATEKVKGGLKTVKAIAASEAFRKYDWLRDARIPNLSGNFRGMVVSKKWAAVFHFTGDLLKPVEKLAVVAALAENLDKSRHQIEHILESSDPPATKAARLSTQVSSVAIRTVAGLIPSGTHVLAVSMSGYCQLAGLMGSTNALKLNEKLKNADSAVTTSFNAITDGENISTFINAHLVIK